MEAASKIRTYISNNPILKLFVKDKTLRASTFDPATLLEPFNPDDLYQRDGTYETYEDMVKDDQVSVALQLKKDLVLNSGFEIIPQGDEDIDIEIKEFLEKNLIQDLPCPFVSYLEDILSGYEFGFSISEKVFHLLDGKMLALKYIKTRHPGTWLLETDRHGNIAKYKQRVDDGEIVIDPRHLIHFTTSKRFGNPYGISDLRAAHQAWFIKREIVKYYAIFLEKHASPTPVARYDKNAPKAAIDDLHNAIKKFQVKTAMTIPKDIEIDFIESNSNGESYINAINMFNMFIGRSLLIPDLMGFQGEETAGGSYSLGTEQMDVFFRHIDRRKSYLEDLINREIIKPIVNHNWGDIEAFPRFKFKPIREEDAKEAAKIWIEAVNGGIYKPTDEEINHFKSILKFPESEKIERVEDNGEEEQTNLPSQELPKIEDVIREQNEIEAADGESETPGDVEKEDDKANFESTKERLDIKKDSPFSEGDIYDPEKENFDFKTDYKKIEDQLDKTEEHIIDETKPVIDLIYEDLFDQIKKKKILEKKDLSLVDKIKLRKLKDINQILKKNFRENYKRGKEIAMEELLKAQFAQPLIEEEFLDLLDQEIFSFVGDWETNITKGARTAIVSAIKDGAAFPQIIREVEDTTKKSSRIALERFARTKTTEVFNKARRAFFDDSGIVAGYQYSAILDGRTTEICRGLHNKKFKMDDPVLPTPPMHFNCRSTLVPITTFEKFSPSKSVKVKDKEGNDDNVPIDIFIKEKKGDNFPVG